MARDFNREDGQSSKIGICHICSNTDDQIARHRHWLNYDGDLAKHLRDGGTPEDTITGILAWKSNMRERYGDMIDEQGYPLSVAESRRQQHALYDKVFSRPEEPRQDKGRGIAFQALRHLLKHTKSEHARGWLDMLDAQFPEAPVEERAWADFCSFTAEFERSAGDPDNAVFTQRTDTAKVVNLFQHRFRG